MTWGSRERIASNPGLIAQLDNALGSSMMSFPNEIQFLSSSYSSPVIPEGAGPVKTNLCVVLVRSAGFLVLAGRGASK
ncbi:MAG TPA: hypothetical protein VEF72_13130 [Mycobacterium sp.]|nr:hypothetical protein [Mycobacterium sp.]